MTLSLLIFLVMPRVTLAAPLEFFTAQLCQGCPQLLVPRRAEESAREGWERYRQSLARHFPQAVLPREPFATRPFRSAQKASETDVVMILNRPERMVQRPAFQEFLSRIRSKGAHEVFLPVMAGEGLSPLEIIEFQNFVAQNFDAMMPLGGPDLAPESFNRIRSFAIDTHPARDERELGFVRQFIRAKRGVFYGICRGHQVCGVAFDVPLTQDIFFEREASLRHLDDYHPIELERDSWLARAVGDQRVSVRSKHHQAVELPEGHPQLRVTGRSLGDPVPLVEAMEFRNGLGFTTQFHFELMMDREEGRRIADQVIMTANHRKQLRSAPGQRIFSCPQGFESIGSGVKIWLPGEG